jgi:adenosylhomocysteine nucleosidase
MKDTSLSATGATEDWEVTDLGGLPVLFVMATEQEYGPHLRARIKPVITGIGPIRAAVGTAAALGELDKADRLPALVVSLGTAGSAKLDHAGVYQAASVAYRDMDASLLGFEKGVTPFSGEPATIPIAPRIPGLPPASISSGGAIVSGTGYDAIDADMADMETYSVFEAARRFGVAMVGIRAISDGRADLTGLHDWMEFLHILDEKLALTVDALASDIAAGRFQPKRDGRN